MTILQNAIDSIQLGIEDYELIKENPKRLISCTRNLFSGILLLFKYYLYTVNPDLIYIPLKSKEKGRKKTLDFKQLKDKLDESQVLIEWGELEKIQKIRNDIEHKYSDENPLIILGLVAVSYNVINDFVRKYLQRDPIEIFGEEIWSILIEVDRVYQIERNQCINDLDSNTYYNFKILELIKQSNCSECGFDVIKPLKNNTNSHQIEYRCLSCFKETDYHELIVSAIEQEVDYQQRRDSMFGDSLNEVFCTCPSCWTNAYSIESCFCFSCQYQAKQICDVCESSLTGDEISFQSKFCSACRNRYEKVMAE